MPTDECKSDILMIIKTLPEAKDRRKILRDLYKRIDGSISFCGPYFIVGENSKQTNFTNETDLIVGSFDDSYQNLPTKSLAALQFALTKDFKYLVTSDDDFQLIMNDIIKIDDTWFHLGEFFSKGTSP